MSPEMRPLLGIKYPATGCINYPFGIHYPPICHVIEIMDIDSGRHQGAWTAYNCRAVVSPLAVICLRTGRPHIMLAHKPLPRKTNTIAKADTRNTI
jgi:hypothetical protein